MQEPLPRKAELSKQEPLKAGRDRTEQRLTSIGGIILRYGIVLFLIVFGLAKWTKAEALGIEPLVAHSPLMFWLYRIADVQHVSEIIGVVELTIATLILFRPFRPLISAVGSLLAIPMFFTTLSFLVTTPGLTPNSPDAGFLMKDLILLGAAFWSAGEALRAARAQSARKLLAL